MAILYVGIDLAKNVFAIHGVDEHGKAMLVRPSVQRARLHQLVAALPPCTIGMEACSGAHHWARLFAQHGHAVRLMAPKFVAPYRPTQPLGHGTRGQTRLLEGGHRHRRQERPHGRRASSIRVRSNERCTMTGCSPAVRTLVLRTLRSPQWPDKLNNLLDASLRDTSRPAIA
jgi:transposase